MITNYCRDNSIDYEKTFRELSDKEKRLILYGESAEKYSIRYKKMNAFSAPLFRDKLPLILAALALFLSVTTAILWIVSPRHRGETIKPSVELRDKYYELLIEKKISDAFDKEKLDYLFYRNGAFAADTIRNNNSRSTK